MGGRQWQHVVKDGVQQAHFSTITGPPYSSPTKVKSSGVSLSWSQAWPSFSSSGIDTPFTALSDKKIIQQSSIEISDS